MDMGRQDTSVRPPGVAGTFYPAESGALSAGVRSLIEAGAAHVQSAGAGSAPKALIAPHAGYAYSGAIAGTAYGAMDEAARARITRVLLLGPAHRVGFQGIAVPSVEALGTPLGPVALDTAARNEALAIDGVDLFDEGFTGEHSLEVHLPFIAEAFPNANVAPFLIGQADEALVGCLLDTLWGGDETLVIISSDLSHFEAYDAARAHDRNTSDQIEQLRGDGLRGEDACGYRAIRGLLACARRLDLRATALDLRSSGDTAGDRAKVVGYGAYAFEYAASARISKSQRVVLLDAARRSIINGLNRGQPAQVSVGTFAAPLCASRATFVSLHEGTSLRGCVGSLVPRRPLIKDVVENAFRAAFADPRFAGLNAETFARCTLEISILSHARAIPAADETELLAELRPDRDGLIIEDTGARALFLPVVWKGVPDPVTFLSRLREKAGLKPDHWSETFRAFRFTAETFGADVAVLQTSPSQ